MDNWQAQHMVATSANSEKWRRFRALSPACLAGILSLSITGCASLPTNGPTMNQVVRDARSPHPAVPFTLLPLDAVAVSRSAPTSDAGLAKMQALADLPGPGRADLIRPGDTLSISIFEVGVSLFGGGAMPPAGAGTAARTPTAATQSMSVEVREDGFIDLPYAGRVMAAGAYPEELATVIRQHLKALSENPAVSVGIADSVKSVVYVSGAVVKSGRYRLTAAHERLLDAVAIAGGAAVDTNDVQVRVERGAAEASAPLNRIDAGDPADIALRPGDRIQLIRVRPSYTVFGASDKNGQVYFESKEVTLAEAIARVAGPSDYRANPRGVFVCRYETGPDGQPKPVVYQLNMMKTGAYFLAQRFQMHDKDVILFSNASGTITQKLFSLLSNLFSPVTTVRFATQ